MIKDKDKKTAYDSLPVHKKEGINILLSRKRAGLTQSQLANALNVSRSAVSRIETGERRVEFSEMLKIANVLGVPLSVISPIEQQNGN